MSTVSKHACTINIQLAIDNVSGEAISIVYNVMPDMDVAEVSIELLFYHFGRSFVAVQF